MAQKFSTGLMITTGLIAHEMEVSVSFTNFVQSSIQRHIQGDWGDLDEEDRQLTEEAITDGSRILSSYVLQDETKIWIITEANREVTTLLEPSDY